ncbi:MAG: exosome complex RNA-binding protein Csl4 [Hadesarchaea archaeon]|nr:exosome complex RNA-binding protein Csl4 [Hadesarchaea archaeon]
MPEVSTGDFVVPGDFLATAEEFVPGNGAYEENGKIYAANTGVVLVDARTKHISVFSRTAGVPTLKRGDIIIGRIEEVRDQNATVVIGSLRGREDRALPPPNLGSIHISQTDAGYVKDLSREFRVGDIVRAKVINANREPVQLSTVGEDLGVIVAFCSRCRTPLTRQGKKLVCESCGNVEFRKMANDYRKGVL